MSLWTPSGEHPVDRGRDQPAARPAASGPAAPAGRAGDAEPTEEELRAFEAELAAARRQLEELPAGVVVAQYSLQFYELAAIHLSRTPPALAEASVAIDALAAVVEAVGDRMADGEATVREALRQLQLAYVELARQESSEPSV